MTMGTNDQSPTIEEMRTILTGKRDQHRREGYEYAINEEIQAAIGNTAGASVNKRLAGQSFVAAQLCDKKLAELPKEGEGTAAKAAS